MLQRNNNRSFARSPSREAASRDGCLHRKAPATREAPCVIREERRWRDDDDRQVATERGRLFAALDRKIMEGMERYPGPRCRRGRHLARLLVDPRIRRQRQFTQGGIRHVDAHILSAASKRLTAFEGQSQMASYTVVNKSNAAIFWHEHFSGEEWYSDDLAPGQSREVPSGVPSARRGSPTSSVSIGIGGGLPQDVPVTVHPAYRNRPDENANVTIYAKQGDRYVNWGNVWILLGKTLGNLCKSQSAMIVV